MELAAIVDMGVHFMWATYSLEGDGLLVIKCYEEISKIRAVITSDCYPNLQAAVRSAFPGDVHSFPTPLDCSCQDLHSTRNRLFPQTTRR